MRRYWQCSRGQRVRWAALQKQRRQHSTGPVCAACPHPCVPCAPHVAHAPRMPPMHSTCALCTSHASHAAHGVVDLELLSGEDTRRLEPQLTCTMALLSPSTGSFNHVHGAVSHYSGHMGHVVGVHVQTRLSSYCLGPVCRTLKDRFSLPMKSLWGPTAFGIP